MSVSDGNLRGLAACPGVSGATDNKLMLKLDLNAQSHVDEGVGVGRETAKNRELQISIRCRSVRR